MDLGGKHFHPVAGALHEFHVQPYPRPERLERHPRTLAGSLINFAYNPNVAPTEQVPTFLRRTRQLARFGINLPTKDGKSVRPC